MNNDNSTFEFENRTYINPDISRDEQTDFINTLRDIQAQNNAQIATETHNLGTDIDHPRGGLSGSEEYWKGRYQTPQTEAAIANMKAVAQQSALNTALSNYNNMLQNRYNQAYRDYNKRLYEHNRKREKLADSYYTNGGGGNGSGSGASQTDGNVIEEANDLARVNLEENPVNVPNNTKTETKLVQQAAANNVNAGGGGIPYGNSGTGYVVEDKNGNPTGIRIYYDGNGNILGADTKMTSMTRDGVIKYLDNMFSGGGKIYTTTGREISTALGWRHAMGVH